jgi:hypothetical protein
MMDRIPSTKKLVLADINARREELAKALTDLVQKMEKQTGTHVVLDQVTTEEMGGNISTAWIDVDLMVNRK